MGSETPQVPETANAAPFASAPPPIPFRNSYASLGPGFSARVQPTPVAAPALIALNRDLAAELGLHPDALPEQGWAEILGGNRVPEGAEPLAMAYAGHQFGYFVPQLGDGRANLLGEVVAPDGRRLDLQLKGAGRTPFSRGGDGRAALGPVLREYVVSEAMAALGVPSTRALAAVSTGETVQRETRLPGAVLTRVASSHIRVGTFQYFAAREDAASLRTLAGYVQQRHYPELAGEPKPYAALLRAALGRQARLVAQWMMLGFVHGVMNTDNMAVSGETIDFGPCAFLETYDPDTVFSSIDVQGRYAFGNQPRAASWNLARFAETLLPLLAEEAGGQEAAIAQANEALGSFAEVFEEAHRAGLRRKLGLVQADAADAALAGDLLERMTANQVDFTRFFRLLSDAAGDPEADGAVRALFARPNAFDEWAVRWRERLARESTAPSERAAAMRKVNPLVIPRNHRVEEMIAAAVNGDFAPFHDLLEAVTHPFEDRPGTERFTTPAAPDERVTRTFCGT